MAWTASDLPDQTGRRVVVTGGNSGLGLVCVRELARRGADVVLACRDTGKGERAAEAVRRDAAGARVAVEELDLADLASVRAFAQRRAEPVDVLVNNAGVMALPRDLTADGFERQFGTNHLGHFALTGLLLDALRAGTDARVVTVSSMAHRMGRLRFDDLQRERRYERWTAYAQSKLANLLFMRELDRRARERGWPLTSVAAHPGYAATNLQLAGARMEGSALKERAAGLLNRVLAQSDEAGARSQLYAATMPLPGGAFVGPDGPGEARGHPRLVGMASAARDDEAARRLWEASEQLTGVRYPTA